MIEPLERELKTDQLVPLDLSLISDEQISFVRDENLNSLSQQDNPNKIIGPDSEFMKPVIAEHSGQRIIASGSMNLQTSSDGADQRNAQQSTQGVDSNSIETVISTGNSIHGALEGYPLQNVCNLNHSKSTNGHTLSNQSRSRLPSPFKEYLYFPPEKLSKKNVKN